MWPLISNSSHQKEDQTKFLAYQEKVDTSQAQLLTAERERAGEYNKVIGEILIGADDMDPQKIAVIHNQYQDLLNLERDGIMGYVTIPKIDITMPIYHDGMGDRNGAIHLQNTSLPIGSASSHAVISAHTGLHSERQFTDLDQMVLGDTFYLYVLGQRLAYRTEQIKVVELDDVSDLTVIQGKDYVTLLTCTPYGINSHRLLVRGERVPENQQVFAAETGKGKSQWYSRYRGQLIKWLIFHLIMLQVISFVAFSRHPAARAARRIILKTVSMLIILIQELWERLVNWLAAYRNREKNKQKKTGKKRNTNRNTKPKMNQKTKRKGTDR